LTVEEYAEWGDRDLAEASKEKTPGVALSKAYQKDFDGIKPVNRRPETALTGTYSKTGKPGGELKKRSVEEGLGKTIKRSIAGWGAFDKDKPKDVVNKVKGQDTDVLKRLSDPAAKKTKGSPAELQQKAIGRELKKRDQGVSESYDLDAFPGIKFVDPTTGKMGSFYYWSSMEGKNAALSMITNKQLVAAHDDGTPMTWDEYKQALDAGYQGVAEGLNDTQKKIEDTILKLEQRLKFAKTPEQWDNIKDRIERLQAGLNRSKQGVAEVSQQTLQSYRKKAAKQKSDALDVADRPDTDDATWVKNINIASKRKDGIAAANKRLGVAEGVDPATYPARAQEAHEKYLKYENMVDQELRKLGQRLPQSWDAARMRQKLSGDAKYALALKYYDLSEKFASLSIRYEELAKKRGMTESLLDEFAQGLNSDPNKQGMAESIPDVDHMHGDRGINLSVADNRDLLSKSWEIYGNYKKWSRDVDRVNSELLDDNADITVTAGGEVASINNKRFAAWSNRNGNGDLDIALAKKYSQQDVAEDEFDQYETGAMDEQEAVAAMFTRLARRGRDPIDLIANRFGWGTHELDDLAQANGFADSAEWLNSFELPLGEAGACNHTMEGEMCPEHGLTECGMHESQVAESQEGDALLARIKSLALLQ
jgi:hypothetical protein